MAVAGTLTYKTELDTSGVKKSGSTVKSIIAGLGITKMISKAMSTITSSIDGAISRYDTLNNFPKVMSNLGISARESEKAIKKMSDKLSGLPTTLDQGAMAVQRFTSKNGDVAKSTDIFLALNNAILAGGASTEIQAQALEQMSQAYAKGKPDMMEWRSIMTAMPAQLNQVAQAMGYGKNGADDLGEALRHGDVSMDKFMNTIVKLNTKGVKGFKNFEEQARNSTAGIGTAIQVAKTQIVKGLANIIDGIDKSLKKSGTSINKIISNLGKNAKKVLDNIAKAISKINFVAIYNTLKKLLPVIISVTTAWVAYHVAIKAIALIQIAKTITSTALAFIKLIPSIKSAKDAMTLLNMTFKSNPIGLVVGGITALTTALAFLIPKNKELTESEKEQQEEMEKQNQKLEEQTENIKQNKEAWEDLQKSKQNSIDTGMTEISHYQNLYDELTSIVDANGRVKKGYEERANFITSQLSEALGIEIKMVDGVIQKYDNLKENIDKVIEKKKAQIILDSQETLYAEAIEKQSEALSKLRDIEGQRNEESAKRKDLLDKLEQAEEEARKNSGKWSASLRAEKDATIEYYKNLIKQSDDRLNTLKSNYEDQKDLLKGYAYSIGQYEKNMELAHKGEYDKMTTVNWNYVKDYQKSGDAEKAQLKDNIKNTEANLTLLKELKEKNNSDIYDSQIETAEKLLKQQKEDLKKYQDATQEGLENVSNEWDKGVNNQINIALGKKLTFKKVGNDQVQMYVDGVKIGKPKATKEMEILVNNAVDEIKKGKSSAKTAGENLIDGVKNGIANPNKQNSVFSSITSFGNRLLAKLKSSLKEQSPSKATREMGEFLLEGLEIGVKKEENNALKQVSDFGNKVLDKFDINKDLQEMYKEMNRTIQMENAKMNFDVISNNAYNKSLQLPATIDLSANFEGTVPVQLNLDGEKIYDNQQKIAVRKSIQYGGVK